jgi:biotin transport system substrate-specific component
MSMMGLMLFASLIIVYVPGLLQLGIWLNLVKGEQVSFGRLLTMGAVPFIAGDVIKAIAAAIIARGVTPQTSYGREADRK